MVSEGDVSLLFSPPSFLRNKNNLYMKDNLYVIRQEAEMVPRSLIERLDPLSIGVYCKLLICGGRENSRVRDLAAELGLSEERVKKCINALEDALYIEKVARFKDGRIDGMDTYILGFSANGDKAPEKKEDATLFKEEKPKTDTFDIREAAFKEECYGFGNEFPDTMLQKFIRYWTEPNKSHTKMRWELERTWDTHRRLLNWAGRNFNQAPEPDRRPKNVLEAMAEIYG